MTFATTGRLTKFCLAMADRPSTGLIVISAGRPRHLDNLLRGVERGNVRPDETILVSMDGAPVPRTNLPMRQVALNTSLDRLPLARARNTGAKATRSDQLFFLDVDCVPAADYVATLGAQLAAHPGLVMGTPRYLRHPATTDSSDDLLLRDSDPHPDQPLVHGFLETSAHYHLFWSLCFAITRSSFERIGGFDETFVGYGAEDTDFAFSARRVKIPFRRSAAVVFHQPHAVVSPPLDHFDDILTNSVRFRQKWGIWPMAGWLTYFRELGLIDWDPNSSQNPRIIRPPDSALIARCTRPGAPHR